MAVDFIIRTLAIDFSQLEVAKVLIMAVDFITRTYML